MSLISTFNIKLNQKIIPGQVTLGKYDGKHPCLTCASNGGKIIIHDPHGRNSRLSASLAETVGDVQTLNFNESVTTINTGILDSTDPRDCLLVGSLTNLMLYDVTKNSNLFFKEVSDGARASTVGVMGDFKTPLAIIGGNCSLFGFDRSGNDAFWSVTGDNVCSLALLDFTGNGENELIVGSEDFEIRVFCQDEIIHEITETESKSHPISIHSFDINCDGVPELITGWSSGKLDARSMRSGEVYFKENFSSPIAGIVKSDYRLDGKELLIACSTSGEVKGFMPAETLGPGGATGGAMGMNVGMGTGMGSAAGAAAAAAAGNSDLVRDLGVKKQNLLMELTNYEQNQKYDRGEMESMNLSEISVIPANTELRTSLRVVHEDQQVGENITKLNVRRGLGVFHLQSGIELYMATNNDTVVRAAVVFAEGIFEGESQVVHPPVNKLSQSLCMMLKPEKDLPIDLHLKAYVGTRSSTQFHVFEVTRQMQRFASYFYQPNGVLDRRLEVTGCVSFVVKERINRFIMWINQNFLLNQEILPTEAKEFHASFLALRTGIPVQLYMNSDGQIKVLTEDMDIAGDMVQSMSSYFNVDELTSECAYPATFDKVRELMSKVEGFQTMRQRLITQMADNSNVIKTLVVRAEDCRMLRDMRGMKRSYMELMALNRDLISGYKIRSTNHEELLNCLRVVNQIIQKAGKLRLGRYKSQVISLCRDAIQSKNVDTLIKVIKTGSD